MFLIVPEARQQSLLLYYNYKKMECNSFSYCLLKQLKLFYSNLAVVEGNYLINTQLAPQQRLNFLPLPQVQAAFLP